MSVQERTAPSHSPAPGEEEEGACGSPCFASHPCTHMYIQDHKNVEEVLRLGRTPSSRLSTTHTPGAHRTTYEPASQFCPLVQVVLKYKNHICSCSGNTPQISAWENTEPHCSPVLQITNSPSTFWGHGLVFVRTRSDAQPNTAALPFAPSLYRLIKIDETSSIYFQILLHQKAGAQ